MLLRVAARRPRPHEPRRRRAGRRRSGDRPRGPARRCRWPSSSACGRRRRPASHVFASASFSRVSVIAEGVPEPAISAQYVSGDYYAGVGVTPAVGRLIEPADDAASAPPVAVLSHRYWQRRFDGRADAIGRTILVNKVPATDRRRVRGRLRRHRAGRRDRGRLGAARALPAVPARPAGPRQAGLLVAERDGAAARRARPPSSCARRSSRPSRRPRATAGCRPITRSPIGPTIRGCSSSPGAQGHNETRRAQRMPLMLLLALGGLVLAAACVNVSTLLVARADARRRDFALRLAIGASRRGIVGQCIVEALLLSGAAAVAGTVVAWLSRDALRALHPFGRNPTAVLDLPLDGRILAATAGVSVRVRAGVRAAAGAAGQPHRPRDGVPGRRAHARQPPPIVGGARPARRAGGAVARAAGQRRPVLADARSPRRRRCRLRSARPAAVPRRRHVGRLCRRSRRSRCTIASAIGWPRCRACATSTYSRVALLSRVRQNKSFVLPDTAPGKVRAARQHQRRRAQLLRGDGPADPARPRLRRQRSRGRAEGRGRQRDVRAAAVRRRRSDRPAHRVRRAPAVRRRRRGGRCRARRQVHRPARRRAADHLPAGLAARRRRRGVRGARRRRSRGADAGGAGGDARTSIRRCRSSICGRSTSRSSACTRTSGCSPGSRPSSASPRWRWRWPACTGCCRRRCSGGPASSACASRSARRRPTSAG